MRTTVDLPDYLLRRVKARAALDGITLKELIHRFVEQGLRRSASSPQGAPDRERSELPVARASTGRPLLDLTHAELYAVLEEEEVAGGRSD